MENRLLVLSASTERDWYLHHGYRWTKRPPHVTSYGTFSYNPAWSPDGKWIAYDGYDAGIAKPWENPLVERNTFLLFLSREDEPRQITQHPELDACPAWVPENFFSVSPTVDTQTTLWGRLKQAERMTQ